MQTTFIPSRTDDAVVFLIERAQAALDAAADVEYDRRERAEAAVTFDDLLEELAGIDCNEQIEFMECLACAGRQAVAQLFVTLNAAKERIIKRRLAQGE